MTRFMGIDIGSCTSKGVIIQDSRVVLFHTIPSGANYRKTAQTLREELLNRANLRAEDIKHTATTGHGARMIPFSDLETSDLQCCARGISYFFPSARTIIDIQDQASQIIRLNAIGQMIDFANGETCASGGGYFLRVIANILQVELQDIGRLSLQSANPVTFTTGCSVFGESEAISRVSEGFSKEEILAGVHKALVERILSLVNKIGLEQPCAISGGGGLNVGLIKRIEEIKGPVLVPSQPLMVNALGAALIAAELAK